MHLFVQPPLDQWQFRSFGDGENDLNPTRTTLAECLAINAQRLGTGQPVAGHTTIATGHQASLWHPGILAKGFAMSAAAGRMAAGMFHVVVDQDVHPALRLELPVIGSQRLSVQVIELGPYDNAVPTGFQPPVEPGLIRRNLIEAARRLGDALPIDVQPVVEAFGDPPEGQTLAQQVTVALERLRAPLAGGPSPVLFVSQMIRWPIYGQLLKTILGDARRCVTSYNQAVGAYPDAGVARLQVEPDRVELPLWAVAWSQPRLRVFADLAGPRPMFTLDNGEPMTLGHGKTDQPDPKTGRYQLAPRALLMTAFLRRWCCNLFIHGTGGGRYDRVTARWWGDWRGEDLAPITIVSADLPMRFSVPISDATQLQKAVWWARHVRYNVDRVMPAELLDAKDVARKHCLLDHMDDDRDRSRRAAAFAELHQINRRLADAAGRLLTDAQAQLDHTKTGLANHAAAMKRDWFFGLYEPDQLRALATAFGDWPNRHKS